MRTDARTKLNCKIAIGTLAIGYLFLLGILLMMMFFK